MKRSGQEASNARFSPSEMIKSTASGALNTEAPANKISSSRGSDAASTSGGLGSVKPTQTDSEQVVFGLSGKKTEEPTNTNLTSKRISLAATEDSIEQGSLISQVPRQRRLLQELRRRVNDSHRQLNDARNFASKELQVTPKETKRSLRNMASL